jgi:hypothetical protein
VSIARAGGRVHRPALHHQTLTDLLGRHLIIGSGHDLMELTPLGLRALASVGLQRIRQQAAARRGRVPKRSQRESAVGWLIVVALLLVGVSALLSELCLHHTAATSARIGPSSASPSRTPPDEVSAPMRCRLVLRAAPGWTAAGTLHLAADPERRPPRPVGSGARRPP